MKFFFPATLRSLIFSHTGFHTDRSRGLRDKKTKRQKDKKTKRQRDKETKGRKDKETKSRRDKGTKGQRNKGTKRRRDKETKRRRDKGIKEKGAKTKPRKPLEEYGGCAAAVMLPFWSYKSKLLTSNRQHPPCLLLEGCHSLQGDKQK